MMLYVITNLIYSGNPFLIRKIFEYSDEPNLDKVRRTTINIKYWYASMPDECKAVLQKVISNKTFEIKEGVHYRCDLASAYSDGWRPSDAYFTNPNTAGTIIAGRFVEKNKAASFSAALHDKKLSSPPPNSDSDVYSIVDEENDMVFKVTPQFISLIDQYGDDIVVLNEHQQHALIIYGAIKGVQTIETNLQLFEELKFKDSMKDKIRELYNGNVQEKDA